MSRRARDVLAVLVLLAALPACGLGELFGDDNNGTTEPSVKDFRVVVEHFQKKRCVPPGNVQAEIPGIDDELINLRPVGGDDSHHFRGAARPLRDENYELRILDTYKNPGSLQEQCYLFGNGTERGTICNFGSCVSFNDGDVVERGTSRARVPFHIKDTEPGLGWLDESEE